MPKWQRAAICLAALAVTCVFFINFCNLVYQCGCVSLWAGADKHCNIHHGPKHCPWCSSRLTGYLVWITMAVSQTLVSFWPAPWRWPARLFWATAAFPLVGVILALPIGLYQGYWN
ncbi:MAG TPA: hypothetical protein VM120_30295 [Bryobacteraceae bacterium]|nr:hypothetical protein [Bryobacteraceae bacterium]